MTNATKLEKKSFNVRGRINSLDAGTSIRVPRSLNYKPSYVRTVSSVLAADTGKKFSVKVTDRVITVTRIS